MTSKMENPSFELKFGESDGNDSKRPEHEESPEEHLEATAEEKEFKECKRPIESSEVDKVGAIEAQTIETKKEAGRYAQEYAKLEITGSQYLAYREVKALVPKYVRGHETLDYGCGCGKSSRFLKTLGLNVSGVDINEDMIKYACENDVNGDYSVITSGDIPARDDSYDLVFSSWVMVEVSTKSEFNDIGKEIGRVLKPDGIFIMIVCNKNTYNNDWLSENTEFEENRELHSGSRVRILFKDTNLSIYDYFWTEEDYKTMLDGSGMQLLETHSPLGNDSDGHVWKLERFLSPLAGKEKTVSPEEFGQR